MLSLLTITEGVRDLFVNSSCSHFRCFLHNPTKCSEPGEECHETWHCWLSDEAFMSHVSLQGMFLLRLQAHIDTNCPQWALISCSTHCYRRWKYITFKASSSLWEQHLSLPKWLLSHMTGGGQVADVQKHSICIHQQWEFSCWQWMQTYHV